MGSVFDRKQHRDELRPLDTTPNRHNKRKISTTLPWRALSHSLHPRDREPWPERRASLPAQSRASRHLSRECAPAQTTESRAIQKPLTLYGGPRSVDNVLDPRFISGKDLRISDILSPRRQYAPMISSFMSRMAFYELMEFSVANSKKPYRNYGDLSATSKSGRKQTFSVVVSRQYLGPAASTIPTTVAHGSLAMFGSSAVSASAPAVMTAGVSSTDDMTKRLAYRLLRALSPFFTFSPTVAAAISHEPQFILLSISRANYSSLMLPKRSEGPHVAPGEPTPDLVDVGEEPSRLVIVPTKRPPGEKPFQIPEATGKPARYPEALVLTPSVESSRCLQALHCTSRRARLYIELKSCSDDHPPRLQNSDEAACKRQPNFGLTTPRYRDIKQ
ncbi:uncharacterized protein CLUP02_10605 [Colletotrichum lupini]|uniref:Uncharacterized protein n=1 Tax=Colletotrichum lupini TaxID=145971 RepID=A0A9Q8SWW9_9PEZI|nr:uncharacterized protein CLUP02_10605 [Colletotrichum lupini]UQC85109.1 hypothetical protein CLUP02_10605 [Colletotrichum lupini]